MQYAEEFVVKIRRLYRQVTGRIHRMWCFVICKKEIMPFMKNGEFCVGTAGTNLSSWVPVSLPEKTERTGNKQ